MEVGPFQLSQSHQIQVTSPEGTDFASICVYSAGEGDAFFRSRPGN